MEKQTNDEIEIDLIEIFHVLKAKLWIIVLAGLITASAAYLISSFYMTPIYTSKSQLYILSKSNTLMSLADLQLGSQLTQDYMVLVKSRPVVTQVIDNLGLDMTYEEMTEIVSVSNPTNTRILQLEVDYPDASMAKVIVDEFARVSSIQIAQIMDTAAPSIVEEGFVQPNPSSPNKMKNTMIGGFAGLFLSIAVIVVLHIMNDRIKDEEDIERHLGITTLGLIPIESRGVTQSRLDNLKRKRSIKTATGGKSKPWSR